MSLWDTLGDIAPWVLNPFVAASVAQADAGYTAAGGKALNGGGAPPPAASTSSTDANDQAFIDSLKAGTNGYLYGNPAEQAHYNEYQQGLAAFGLSPDTVITRNGQPLVDPVQQPGALAKAQRAEEAARAQQAGFNQQYANRTDDALSALGNSYSGLNASDEAILSNFLATQGGISIPDSQAAQAFADPASIAAQKQAEDMLLAAANGSLNVSTNPADLARQQQSYAQLQGAANGSLDAHTNPEDLARQAQAADKLWGLTDPQMTAQERFLMEKFRQEEEHSRQAAMDAALRNLSARGQLGSGGEIGALLGSQQTTSQNRMLQDLGAQANAVQRAQQSLGLYSDLSTQMRNASDAMTSGNMNRREGAMEGAGSMATSMRNASDALASGNANRQLGATESAGSLAGQQRGQSFGESLARGNAADATSRAQADLSQHQAETGLNAGLGVNGRIGGRADNLFGAQTGVAGSQLAANSGLTGIDLNIADKQFGRGWQAVQANNDLLSKAFALNEQKQAEAALNQPAEQGFIDKLLPWNW